MKAELHAIFMIIFSISLRSAAAIATATATATALVKFHLLHFSATAAHPDFPAASFLF